MNSTCFKNKLALEYVYRMIKSARNYVQIQNKRVYKVMYADLKLKIIHSSIYQVVYLKYTIRVTSSYHRKCKNV